MVIALPLYIFLFLYFLVLAIFAAFVLINFYHIVGSGTLTVMSFTITFFTATLTVFTLYETYLLLQGTNWQETIPLFNSNWITNLFPPSTL